MSRTSLQDVRSVGDPLFQHNWDLLIPRFPGVGDSRAFTFKCQTAVIPGFMLEQVAVRLHGVELRYPGTKNYSHTFPLTVLETNDLNTRDMFLAWSELARSWNNNSGASSDVYKATGYLILYNDAPAITREIQIQGMYPETVDDFTLDGQTSGVVAYSMTLSYDSTFDL